MMEIYILITLEVQKHEDKNMAKAACFSAGDDVDGIILADDGIGGGVAAKRRILIGEQSGFVPQEVRYNALFAVIF